jgi:hypothetical protein
LGYTTIGVPVQAAAVRNLYQPRSQRDLANRLELDASSITDIADQLEAKVSSNAKLIPTTDGCGSSNSPAKVRGCAESSSPG